jgi:gliding motility-associated transport system ATP-binding protein
MIEVDHLSKSYGSVEAVRDISFEVEQGAVVGFLGPNGAGKSTTLRILAGFLGATSGRVRIGGHDIVLERMKAARSLGYMPETSPLYPEMRVGEYLRFRAELKRVGRLARKAEVARVLGEARIADVAEVVIGHLSKGYRQRVGLADALIGSPPLLILDEPTAGLDPNQIQQVRALIRRLAEKHTILLSTHILPEVEAVCDRALIIHRGRLVAEGKLDSLRKQGSSLAVELTLGWTAPRTGAEVEQLLGKIEGVAALETQAAEGGEGLRVALAPGAEPALTAEAIVRALVEAGVGVRRVLPVVATLEQVFAELTGAEKTEAAAPKPDAKPDKRKKRGKR